MLALAGGGDWIPAMAGAMHPPFRRGEIRFAPQPPDGDGCAALLCPSSPHKIFYFAGAPLLRKERMRRARWKRENGGAEGGADGLLRKSLPAAWCGLGFGGDRMDRRLCSLPLVRRVNRMAAPQGRTCVSALFRGGKFSQRRKNLFVGPDPLVRPFSQGPGASGSRAFKNIKISS